MNDHSLFFRVPSILVEQPLAPFVLAMIPSDVLLETCYSIPAKMGREPSLLSVFGSQRGIRERRLKEIARYLESTDAAIPNTIILGANYWEDGTAVDAPRRWTLEETGVEGVLDLVIPRGEQTASIIDGQHRLLAFEKVQNTVMPLACSVYLDLPIAYHAFVFATINFNQQKVDRSLAYQLFGASLDEEPSAAWSPEKVAVFLARKLDADETSPFAGRLRLGLEDLAEVRRRTISLATVVDGILSLVSANPKKDRDMLARKKMEDRDRRRLEDGDQGRTPLRSLYRQGNDLGIFQVCRNFFAAAKETLWDSQEERSYIGKTVGVQALFDLLRLLLGEQWVAIGDARQTTFSALLQQAAPIDFSDSFFQASGTGRTRIRNVLLSATRIRSIESLRVNDADRTEYDRLLRVS